MKADALIFDVDGTLWSACPATAKGWTKALAQLGIDRTITAEEIESVAGNPYDKCVEILLPGLSKNTELLDALNQLEKETMDREGGSFYPGVLEGMKDLATHHRLFLVSNCQDWYLEFFLRFSGLGSILAGYDCNGRSGLSKGEMLIKMKREHGLKNPVYIGDTAGDEEAARVAEMEFVHAAYGFGKPKRGHLGFHSFRDLVEYFSV